MGDVMEKFLVGDMVKYVPFHAKGDASHPDCEHGIITSMTEHSIFVEYGTGTSQSKRREDLVLIAKFDKKTTRT